MEYSETDASDTIIQMIIHTCDDVSVAVLHAVLVLLGRIPGRRLTLKEALKRDKDTEREIHELHLNKAQNPLQFCKREENAFIIRGNGTRVGGPRWGSDAVPCLNREKLFLSDACVSFNRERLI